MRKPEDMPAMALLDRNGVYGSPRFTWQPKRPACAPTSAVEITLQNGRTYPLLAASREGYRNFAGWHTHETARAKGRSARPLWRNFAEFSNGYLSHRAPTSAVLDIFGKHALCANWQRHHTSRGRGAHTRG